MAERTPGPLGRNDAADPNCKSKLGDTPGTLGVNDGAENIATGQSRGETGALPLHEMHRMVMAKVPPDLKIPKGMSPAGSFLIMREAEYMRGLYALGTMSKYIRWYMNLSALLANRMLLGIAQFFQDPQGWQLFAAWASGSVPKEGDEMGELIISDDDWTEYMRKAPGLSDQIKRGLASYAAKVRERLASPAIRPFGNTDQGNFEFAIHGEVAGDAGGYRTGYELLHGSNRTVGDLTLKGTYKAKRFETQSQNTYDVLFENLEYVWNDIIDHNARYAFDIIFQDYFRMLSVLGWGVSDPQDYIVRIRWSPGGPVRITEHAPF